MQRTVHIYQNPLVLMVIEKHFLGLFIFCYYCSILSVVCSRPTYQGMEPPGIVMLIFNLGPVLLIEKQLILGDILCSSSFHFLLCLCPLVEQIEILVEIFLCCPSYGCVFGLLDIRVRIHGIITIHIILVVRLDLGAIVMEEV